MEFFYSRTDLVSKCTREVSYVSSMKTKIYYLMEKKNATTWSGFTLSPENAWKVAKSIKKRNQSVPLSLPPLARERCKLVSVVS